MARRRSSDPSQTPEERLQELKLRVFSKYARRNLHRKWEKSETIKDGYSWKTVPVDFNREVALSDNEIEDHKGRQNKALQTLLQAGVLSHRERHGWVINKSLFNQEGRSLARFNLGSLQLDPKYIFRQCKSTSYGSSSNINFNTIGSVEFEKLDKRSFLWIYFNEDKVQYTEKKDEHDYVTVFVSLKDSGEDIIRARLQTVLFTELRNEPTRHLANFCGVKWVGALENSTYVHHHGANEIIKDGLNLIRAEKEIRNHASHFRAYAKMLHLINVKLRGKSKLEVTTEFVKFMVNDMYKNAPLRLQEKRADGYKYILENAAYFTFENLFPDGITKQMITEYTENLS